MQQLQRTGAINGGTNPSMYPSSHHMRLAGPPQGRMPTAQPRHNGQQYAPMMQSQLQRQVSIRTHTLELCQNECACSLFWYICRYFRDMIDEADLKSQELILGGFYIKIHYA